MSAAYEDADDTMSDAVAAWVRWTFETADTLWNTDRVSFLAGYERALLDAADAIHSELGVSSDGGTVQDEYQHAYGHARDEAADWLRSRAASVAGGNEGSEG